MRIRRKPWAREELAACGYYIRDGRPYKGRWAEVFGNDRPIYLDLGCGKGGFAAQLAFAKPDVNIVAVDIKSDMLGVARRTVERRFDGLPPENIRLLTQEIAFIGETFGGGDAVERIYINFGNPWYKERHKKRRLTHPRFLIQYKAFLKEGGRIVFKTDDPDFFEASVGYIEQSGFEAAFMTRDLRPGDITDDIATEHEAMFVKEGRSIRCLIAEKPAGRHPLTTTTA
jgi:tRNA (guanine-N7-)-methyltransferase